MISVTMIKKLFLTSRRVSIDRTLNLGPFLPCSEFSISMLRHLPSFPCRVCSLCNSCIHPHHRTSERYPIYRRSQGMAAATERSLCGIQPRKCFDMAMIIMLVSVSFTLALTFCSLRRSTIVAPHLASKLEEGLRVSLFPSL